MKNTILIALCLIIFVINSCSTSHKKLSTQESEKSAEYWVNLSLAYDKLGMHRESLETMKQGLLIQAPNDPGTHYILGEMYITYYKEFGELDMCQKAVDAYKQAIKLDPNFELAAEAYSGLGIAYMCLTKFQEAVDAYQQAIRLNPKHIRAYAVLGVVYDVFLDKHQEAVDIYKQAIKIKPKGWREHYFLGLIYGKLGMYQEAVDAYKQAIKLNPKNAKTHSNLGEIYLLLNDRESALKEYEILKDLDPKRAKKLFEEINK